MLEEILQERLHERGRRLTHERVMIVRHIEQQKRHFTPEQLIADLCENERISAATIYNTLLMLEELGLIRRVERSRHTEYELTKGERNSLRYICTKCGREVHFKEKPIENILNVHRFSNFTMDNFSLTVYGTCKTCRRKKK